MLRGSRRVLFSRHLRHLGFLAVFLLTLVVLSACEGCRSPKEGGPNAPASGAVPSDVPPTARLFFVSDLAGALEPCGCVKDQLGGMDHFGALVTADERAKPKGHAVVAAGPLFFLDMELGADKKAQEIRKAETIASALKSLGLAAVAPGRNDFAAGADVLAKLREASGAPLLGANVTAPAGGPPFVKHIVKEIGGLKVGFVGVAAPDKAKVPLEGGVTSAEAIPALRGAIDAAVADGAQALVALAAVGRGEAKRIADTYPELLAVVVGSTGGAGEGNTQAPPAERIGEVLVVETGNHLQTVAVLDLFVKDAPERGLVPFADGTGLDAIRKKEELTARIDELRTKLAVWENDGKVAKVDIEARRKDVAKLEAERDALDRAAPKVSGSFFRYSMRDVRDKLGADDTVKSQILAYYKHVNDHNREAFKDRVPKKPGPGEASYAGIAACTTCHEDARKVWDETRHAHAYETLATQYKEFNLDCVSCHVTGYDRPGGSTVTHVEGLKDVQCEVCHGPGSLHAKDPTKNAIPVAHPKPDSCTACHHPPHVHTFDAASKMADILGPGHGRPKN